MNFKDSIAIDVAFLSDEVKGEKLIFVVIFLDRAGGQNGLDANVIVNFDQELIFGASPQQEDIHESIEV